MRIVHYVFGIPPVRKGGVPRYVLDITKKQAELGHNVSLLMPGPIDGKDIYVKKWKNVGEVDYYRIRNANYIYNAKGIKEPLEFTKKVDVEVYRAWLKKMKVDVFHIHSVLGIHLELVQAAKLENIPMIYTVHDFTGLCPKIDFLKNDICNCTEENWENCSECCKNAYDLSRLQFEHSDFYRFCCQSKLLWLVWKNPIVEKVKKGLNSVLKREAKENIIVVKNDVCEKKQEEYEHLKKYYKQIFACIDFFHYNSNQTRRIFESKVGIQKGCVYPVMHNGISDRREKKEFGKVLRIGYLGNQGHYKGYDYLIQELDTMYENGRKDFCLKTFLNTGGEYRKYIENYGEFSQGQQEQVYKDFDVVVVPSFCYETFGFVVLEALSYGIPIIVSENVGSSMLLEEHEGVGRIIKLDQGSLRGILEEIYDNRDELVSMNNCILESDLNFEYEEHVERIIEIYRGVGIK